MKKLGTAAIIFVLIGLCIDVNKHTTQIAKLEKAISELGGVKGE